MPSRLRCVLALLCLLAMAGAVQAGSADYLGAVQDQFHRTLDVYSDANAAGNHFPDRAQLFDPSSSYRPPSMAEATAATPVGGLTCIRAAFGGAGATWGGWYFENGVLQGSGTSPTANPGTVPNAGIDLTGARTLRFSARGEQGGERVEFLAFGVGRNAVTGAAFAPYPDSSAKVSTGYITLTNQWKEYTIDVSGRDLSYVLGGFGWVSSSAENSGKSIVFYMDEIRYDLPRLDEPRFLQSYRTMNSGREFDLVMSNAAYSYDNAVALIAFLADGGADGRRRAGLIADAFVYAQDHDRFFADGRVRNAYQAGDLALWPGWTPNGRTASARMPGWGNGTRWNEDAVQVGTSAGNAAWTGLALLAYYRTTGDAKYLGSATRLGDWVLLNCADSAHPGFTAGYEGWEPAQTRLTYKATEHNMDLAAFFARLYAITGESRWQDAAGSADAFVRTMWDPVEGKFWTGTTADGVTVNREVVPIDIQAWSVQAMGTAIPRADLAAALQYAESHCRVGQGYDFNTDGDGVWAEGTAQMAVSYGLLGDASRSAGIVQYLHTLQNGDGSLDAASRDGLTTGIYLSDGTPWLYYKRPHVGATGWLRLAETGTNPFLFPDRPVLAVPGGVGLPRDLNGDGLYEDVTGNGGLAFGDVILYFNQMDWIMANEPPAAFDYTRNGSIGFADIIWLFNQI